MASNSRLKGLTFRAKLQLIGLEKSLYIYYLCYRISLVAKIRALPNRDILPVSAISAYQNSYVYKLCKLPLLFI